MTEKITKTDEEWKKELTAEEYEVCRMKGTEQAFTGMYWDCKDDGVYKCRTCGVELFSSDENLIQVLGGQVFSNLKMMNKLNT